MFNKLLASDRRAKRSTITPSTLILSSSFHGLLLVGAVYASVRPPEDPGKPDELVTFVDVADVAGVPEEPPPVETSAPPPPVGAPALIPPIDPPPFIPPPDPAQPRINIEFYSGDLPTLDGPVTLPGATSGGAPEGFPVEHHDSTVYQVWAIDERPEITNRAAIEASMQREYPSILANAGIGGEVIAEFVVLPDGTIDPTTVRIVRSSHARFEEATRKVLSRFRFTPGKVRGEPVRVLTSVPVRWTVGR